LKFTEYGEVKLTARCVERRKVIEFEVKDTGIGMNQDFIEAGLFEPFEQEHCPLIGNYRGVGLGLALSKHMMDSMNGQISVISAKGFGSTFILTLPMVEPPDKYISSFSLARSNITSQQSVHALIVDDNLVNRKVMRHLLENVGFKCTLAESGEVAIDITSNLKDGELDVIFMDIFMPGMGGIKASVRIQALTRLWKREPLIVGCTADTSEKTMKACVEIGITNFIHKPINKEAVKELFANLQLRKFCI